MARYAELHAHSDFSFLDGASDPEELVATAVALGLEAIALTDHHGLYGAVRFAEAARALGIPSVFGTELTLTGGGARTGVPDPTGSHLVVITRNPEGYAALSSLLADAHLRLGTKGCPTVSLEELADRHRGNWVVLTGCRKGPVPSALADAGPREARRALDRLTDAVGIDNVAVELWDHGDPLDLARNEALATIGLEAGAEVVATNNVHYATPASFPLASTFAAIRARRTLAELEGWTPAAPAACLRSAAEQERRFSRFPGVTDRAAELALACAFDLRLVAPRLPDFPTPDGLDEQAYLARLVAQGAIERYGPRGAERVPGAWAQLDHELAVIGSLGYAGYFLIVWDLTQFCKREGIYCQGRGSAANSAACYALGVTNADAVALGLLFERFLSPARDGPPDIDVDIESSRREEVIQYVYARYGRHHAAQVANVITYRPRSAVRDIARALGASADDAASAASRIEQRWSADKDLLGVDAAATAGLDPLVARLASEALGRPRHLGVHSAGMVICDRPVVEVCPVEWARMEGRSVLQWDKDDCAAIGLVKFDLLGLGMLEALHRTVDLVCESTGTQVDLARLPQEDAVYDMLCGADTVGVFQVESRAQMATLPRLRPRCFYDLVIEVALIRPGPIQGNAVNPYLRRRRGEEPVTYLHPLLEPILRRTLGVPLFQEQLMEMAVAIAGFSPAEADELRQAMAAKRSELRMLRLKGRLYAGMAERGVTGETADALYAALAAFANFGFPESHAVSFAHLVYCSAWLKLHHPAAFLASLLNAQPMGFWSPQSLVADARRHGVTVTRPDVDRSAADATVEPYGDSYAVRLGLASVRGVGRAVAERIAAGAPWAGQEDLVRRAGVSRSHLEALAAAGALDAMGRSRRVLTWTAAAAAQSSPDRLEGIVTGTIAPALGEPTPLEVVADDLWALGLAPEATALSLARGALDAQGVLPAAALAGAEADRVVVAGVVTHRQHPETAHGAVFLNLEDETGHVNVIFSKGAWARWRDVAGGTAALVIRGRLERGQGALAVTAEHVRPLDLGAPSAPSRDFR